MTTEDARQYFADKGLDYSVLTPYNLDLLTHIVQEQVLKARDSDKDCILRLVKSHGLQEGYCAFLVVDGTYFEQREAISFNSERYIGFAGWASSKNVKPFIDGFVKWCDQISEEG